MTSQPNWDIDYEKGRQAEMWVSDLRQSLASDSVEVKHDLQARKYGNVYVEYECFRRGKWQPSGIAVTTAKLWVFVLVKDELAIVVNASRLKELARDAFLDSAKRKEQKVGSHPTKGVAIPISTLIKSILGDASKCL